MGMAPDVEAALERKSSLKPALKKQCRGRWELVVLLPNGGFTVYDTVEQADKARARYGGASPAPSPLAKPKRVAPDRRTDVSTAAAGPRPAPPQAPRRVVPPLHKRGPRAANAATSTPAAPSAPVVEEPVAEVIDLTKSRRAETITPGVRVVYTRDKDWHPSGERKAWQPGVDDERFDWSAVDVELKAHQLRDRMALGYPEPMGFWYFPEVLAMEGMDFDIVEDAMRYPDRVEVRPESFSTKNGKVQYPILGFYRGDVKVIVGFREPTRPLILRAEASSRLEEDIHRVNHMGGGGAKRREGLPNTPSALQSRLTGLGATFKGNPDDGKLTVVFGGQELGQVSTAMTTKRDTVHTDWQRMQRKIHAIKQRGEAATGTR